MASLPGTAPRDRARAGRADGRLVLVLLAIVLAVVGGFWALERGDDAPEDDAGIRPGAEDRDLGPAGPDAIVPGRAPLDPDAAPDTRNPAPSEGEPTVGGRRGTPDPDRFTGPPGTIRGQLQVDPNVAVPARWTLVIGPSKILEGSEHAEYREIELLDGRVDFEVTGLPLAGYGVRARAPGMNGYEVPVLLERRNAHYFVNVSLAPAGYLEGVVVDANSAGIEELPLTLEALADGRTWTTATDVVGNFRFADVLDGQYKLHYGHPYSPVAPARTLQMRAPGMVLPPSTIPVLASVWVLVLDREGNTVEGALVRGTGTMGGHVEGRTDANGLLLVRHLPAGRLRLRAEHPDHGSARQAVDLVTGELEEATVRFR